MPMKPEPLNIHVLSALLPLFTPIFLFGIVAIVMVPVVALTIGVLFFSLGTSTLVQKLGNIVGLNDASIHVFMALSVFGSIYVAHKFYCYLRYR